MNILITGGSSGLGAALTTKIASFYPAAKIYFTYNKSIEKAREITEEYKNTFSLCCNFNQKEDIDNLCKCIKENDIEILINNAISSLDLQYFYKTQTDKFSNGFLNNIIPVLSITQAFLILARKRKSGKIITILSSAIINKPPVGLSAYVAEKNYLFSMHKSWAVENVSFGITSNCISPGYMNTALNSDTDDRVIEQMIQTHPLQNLLTTDEVAETAIFLIGASNQLNAQNFVINSTLSV